MRKKSKIKDQILKLTKSPTPHPLLGESPEATQFPRVAFLWDESFLWGLMAYKALKANNLPFELIRSNDIKKGCLKNYKMLFVPGGWASNKLKALGEKGIVEIKKFVRSGGNYLGFCGGAGLATLDGIGLLNIKRMPTGQRVPSFSGRIHLKINKHSIFTHPSVFHAWWPSQFLIDDKKIKTLAIYGNALPDSFSSDLNVGDVEADNGWNKLEKIYGINLDPKRLLNEPAVIEGRCGKGNVLLSLIHFDTPEDANGAMILSNLWKYLARTEERKSIRAEVKTYKLTSLRTFAVAELETAVDDLITLGIRNFLWFWRNPMLLQWRRGVRGLEYCTLYGMIKELSKILRMHDAGYMIQDVEKDLKKIRAMLLPFTEKARHLLILERHALQNGYITYEKCDNHEIQKIRTELFGGSKSHGGLFKELIDEVDGVLYSLIRQL